VGDSRADESAPLLDLRGDRADRAACSLVGPVVDGLVSKVFLPGPVDVSGGP